MAKATPAPLSASLLVVPKGAATPASDPSPQVAQEGAQVTSVRPQPEPLRRSMPEVTPPLFEEPRTALTVRLPTKTQERLREAAHRTRLEKQIIVDEALSAWMDEHGF